MISLLEPRVGVVGWCALVAFGVVACTESGPERPVTGPALQLRTASDSAAFLAQRSEGVSPQSHSGGVTIHAGESAVMTITSAECASIGSVLTVSGALSGTISNDACRDVGATLTLGPAGADGFLFFEHNDPRFGPGSFQFTGTHPSFTVFMEDGFGDGDFNDSVISVELLTACQHNVLRLSQGDAGWGGLPYDNLTGKTIGEKGCALTALTMALNFAGIQKTPGEVNQFMIDNNLFSKGGGVTWGAPVERLGRNQSLKFQWGAATTPVELARQLCTTGKPIVVGVNLDSVGDPHHFVLATGVENGRVKIADPGDRDRTFLDAAYDNEFEVRGSVADPPGDISALEIVVDDADLLVVDPASRETGRRFSTGEKVVEIPQSGHFVDAIDDDITGEVATSKTSGVGIFQPAEGMYQIHVRALTAGPQELSIHAFSSDGRPQPVERIPLNLSAGQVATFSVTFSRTGPVDFMTIASETFSGFTQAQRVVLRTEAAWSAFWSQLYSMRPSPPARPSIDFTRDVVIGVAMGQQPTTGYTIGVDSLRVTGSLISVAVGELLPSPVNNNPCVEKVKTQPVVVVRAPLADVPQADFTVSQISWLCGPQ